MGQKFTDAARAELAGALTASSTTFTLSDGSRFPGATAGTGAVSGAVDWFKAVMQDASGIEIVYVRTHDTVTTPNTLSNVLRGQEGTLARSWSVGAAIGVRMTAADATGWGSKADRLELGTAAAKNAQINATDGTPGALLVNGAYGWGYELDLRNTIYTTGVPQDLYYKGSAIGFGDGGKLTPPIGTTPNYGVLQVDGQYHSTGGKAGIRRVFTNEQGSWYQTSYSGTVWNPWITNWTSKTLDPSSFGTTTAVNRAGAAKPPIKRIVFFYGSPISYMGAVDQNQAIDFIVRDADIFIAADGVEHPAHSKYASTVPILQAIRARGVEVYGYVGLGATSQNWPPATLDQYVGEWATIGVDGIFWDEFGMDYHNTRDRQNAALDYTHNRGLKACCNTWYMEYLLDSITDISKPSSSKGVNFTTYNPSNAPIHLQRGDSTLFEGLVYSSSGMRDGDRTLSGLEQTLRMNKWGLELWGLADLPFTGTGQAAALDLTMTGNLNTAQKIADFMVELANVYGLSAMELNIGGLANANYAYQLPFKSRIYESDELPTTNLGTFTARRRFKNHFTTINIPAAGTYNMTVAPSGPWDSVEPQPEPQARDCKRLCVYYGAPAAYKGLWDVDKCAQGIASEGDIWICGDGYQHTSDPNYATTLPVVAKVRALGVKVYGYISIGVSTNNFPVATLKANVDEWLAVGVDGIFVDEFGFDYLTTRLRQNEIVDYVHGKGLKVAVNPWYASHAICTRKSQLADQGSSEASQFATGNPADLPDVLQAGDAVMWEDFIFGVALPDKWEALKYAYHVGYNAARGKAAIDFWSLAIVPATGTGLAKVTDFTKTGNLTTSRQIGEFLAAHNAVFGGAALGVALGDFGPDGNIVTLPAPVVRSKPSTPMVNFTYAIGYRRVGDGTVTTTVSAAGNYQWSATKRVFGGDWSPQITVSDQPPINSVGSDGDIYLVLA